MDDLGIDKDDAAVVVCRFGVRSTTAAAMLTGMGYTHVFNLKGGMLAWRDAARGPLICRKRSGSHSVREIIGDALPGCYQLSLEEVRR